MTKTTNAKAPLAGVTIRRLGPEDRPAVQRLADLDGAHVPDGPLLGAEVEGRLLAATSLSRGGTIADPFSRTAELRALLELRAGQLRARAASAPERARPFRRGRARPGLTGSPGPGGGLLTQPARPS